VLCPVVTILEGMAAREVEGLFVSL
jgi:hypothetical protein